MTHDVCLFHTIYSQCEKRLQNDEWRWWGHTCVACSHHECDNFACIDYHLVGVQNDNGICDRLQRVDVDDIEHDADDDDDDNDDDDEDDDCDDDDDDCDDDDGDDEKEGEPGLQHITEGSMIDKMQ